MRGYLRNHVRARVVMPWLCAVLATYAAIMHHAFWSLARQEEALHRRLEQQLLLSLPPEPPAEDAVQPVPPFATAAVAPQA